MWCDCSCGRLLTPTTESDKSVFGLRTTTDTQYTTTTSWNKSQKAATWKTHARKNEKPGQIPGEPGGASVCDWPNAVVIVRKFEHIWQSAKVNRTQGWMGWSNTGGRGSRVYGSCQQAAGEKWAEPTTENNSLLSDKAIRSKMGFCIWNTVAVTSWQKP